MTVTADPARRRVVEPAVATTRRLQGLAAIGWPADNLAGEMRVSPVTIRRLTAGQDCVTAHIAERARQLFEGLRDTPGPSEPTRRIAAARGYAPPETWDEADIADPRSQPRPARGRLNAVPTAAQPPASRRSARLPRPARAGGQHPLTAIPDGASLQLPCRDDPQDWFADTSDTEAIGRAKAGCRRCAIRRACLEHAIAHEKYGVWGGLDEDERAAELRRRRRAS
jgi:Transcription factor WhiB